MAAILPLPRRFEATGLKSGLPGVSESSSDVRDLLAMGATDVRAAEAVALFCFQATKWIGAFAAALGGLNTLVFAGGIGENPDKYLDNHSTSPFQEQDGDTALPFSALLRMPDHRETGFRKARSVHRAPC